MRVRSWVLATVLLVPSPPVQAQDSLLDRITLNGYTNFEFEKQLSEQGAGDPNGSFDADQFDLVFNINASERIRVAADLSWEHGTATEDGRGNQALEYGFVEYTFSDRFKLRAGKMLTPFGIFNEVHTAKVAFLTVKEAASLNKTDRIVEDARRFYPRWGAGLQLHGDGVISERDFSYDVQIANGEQEETNPYEEDDNTPKSVAARFRFEPSSSWRVGYSFYYDKTTDPELGTIVSNGLEIEKTWSRFRVQAEVAIGSYSPTAGGLTQVGFYVQPSFHFENGLTPYLRFDLIDPDTSRKDDQGFILIVGLNWEISKNFMLKAENNYFEGGTASSLGQFPGGSYNELKTALSLGF